MNRFFLATNKMQEKQIKGSDFVVCYDDKLSIKCSEIHFGGLYIESPEWL